MVATLARSSAPAAFDPCDRCGAAAAARITLNSGVLHLCGHHLRAHHSRLDELSAVIRLAPDREHLGPVGPR